MVGLGGGGSDRQTTQSRFFNNMCHRHGFKVNYSVGDRSHYYNDERQTSAGLSARERMHFLPPDFIKRRFTGLSLEDRCCQGVGVKGGGKAGTLQCMQSCTCA